LHRTQAQADKDYADNETGGTILGFITTKQASGELIQKTAPAVTSDLRHVRHPNAGQRNQGAQSIGPAATDAIGHLAM
jgi:hypothetical protein